MVWWEHSPKGHRQCYHISPLGSCMPHGLILELEHLQQLPELLRETEDNYHPDTATDAGSYGGFNFSVQCRHSSGSHLQIWVPCCRCFSLHAMVKSGLAVAPQSHGMPLAALYCSLQGGGVISIFFNGLVNLI